MGLVPVARVKNQRWLLTIFNDLLITDHNVHETLAITDRAYLMFEGKILMEGSADKLANDEKARKLYLGETFTLERYVKT